MENMKTIENQGREIKDSLIDDHIGMSWMSGLGMNSMRSAHSSCVIHSFIVSLLKHVIVKGDSNTQRNSKDQSDGKILWKLP